MKKLLALLLSALLVLSANAILVSAEGGVSWSYDNSLLVTVATKEPKVFTPEDFPEVNCKEVWTIRKSIENGVCNCQLVLFLSNNDREGALCALMDNPVIQSATFNTYKENSYMMDFEFSMSSKSVFIPVGGTVDVRIKNYRRSGKLFAWEGVAFEIAPDKINEVYFTTNSFAEQGVSRFWPHIDSYGSAILINKTKEYEAKKSDNHWYYGLVQAGSSDFDAQCAQTLNSLSKTSGIVSVEAVEGILGGGMFSMSAEYTKDIWRIGNESVAGVITFGGEKDDATGNIYNQTATIAGVDAGVTEVSVVRKGEDGWVKTTCAVYVFDPADANGDGEMNNIDAAMILKHDAALVELTGDKLSDCDVNNDGEVNNVDAALILKYDAGL